MSAFQVSADHLNYLVNAARAYRITDDPTALGALLAETNAASVNHRYANLPPVAPVPFRWTPPARPVEPVQVIKAAQCYRYQSSEHPGWSGSDADAITQTLISDAIERLPGYDDADWEIAA